MIKNLIVTLVLVIGLSGLSMAATNVYASEAGVYTAESYTCEILRPYIFITSGTYYVEMSITGSIYARNTTGLGSGEISTSIYTKSLGATKHNYYVAEYLTNVNTYGGCVWMSGKSIYEYPTWQYVGTAANTTFISGFSSASSLYRLSLCGTNYEYYHSKITVVLHADHPNEINGSTDCINNVTKYVWADSEWIYIETNDTSTSDYYKFNVFNNTDYKLIFGDGHEYEFTGTGSDITYNYDGCSHTQYRFEESCGNLIPDSEGVYTENYGLFGDAIVNFYTATGIYDVSNTSADFIIAYTNTFIGSTGWIIDPIVNGTIYTLENPNIAWKLKVIVQNESDGELIDGALVKVDQTCYCTAGNSTRQKKTVSGMSQFGDMSLQDASLLVTKAGYKPLDENTTGYSISLSGRSNFSSKTWVVKLANTSSNNSSTWYETNKTTNLYFRDIRNNITSKILDTDANVYLHYNNNNSNEEAMTLKFQSSSTHSYFIDKQSWNIPHGEIGYKTIPNSNFTPFDYSYRAVMYNSSIYGWNVTIPLTVRNATKEEDQHYENLTTNLLFRHTTAGKIDYRDDMSIGIHARSNNTTLMQIDVELWKDGIYIGCKNLTSTILAAADQPYYYIWNPVFDYVSGSNYNVRMYGYDRTLLETDYVECVTDDTTRKNKLTIIVKDRSGGNLNNAYIYLEDWGSLSTGSTYYNAYEGIDNGDYRYKATKSGYSGGGWDEVTLNDADKIVTYVLTEDYTNTSSTAQKFSDDDIKGFFFPLMFFLLICIVLGGLKYVAS